VFRFGSAPGCKVFHFHSREDDRGTPGKGHLDWKGIVAALSSINYVV
jgi:D-psicose/D-tagatose/L-ribulose 3-epimerase